MMIKRFRRTIFFLVLLAFALSACSGAYAHSSGWPGLSVQDTTAYLSYNNGVYAVDIEKGQVLWQFPEEASRDQTFYAAPVLTPDGKQLLVGSYDHKLYSLDPASGQLLWDFKEAKSYYIGAPLATEAAIYAPNADGVLYALSLDGQRRWTFHSDRALWATPATDGQRLYLPAMDHRLYALNPDDGQVLWQTDLGGAMVSAPALAKGVLYLGTFADKVVAVRAEDGQPLWEASTRGWVWSTPAYAQGRLFFGDVEGAFYALDARDGSLLWSIQPDGPIVDTAAVDQGTVYFTTEQGTLYAVSAEDGTVRWTYNAGATLQTGPVLTPGGIVLIAPTDGSDLLQALNAADGQPRWAIQPAK
ncbi:MAG TPA: PQQ-binding-like beta-propeller repeat protein [Anaerolineae bacterium]|nr:PQQ-binding-like beta-propeller repeat protein [Anaerolineae bacterium]HID85198.1 hypothetical protein [Anaerolineales bacterium]HIQ08351.1 hypothetical protein [Anaerolineaceae bacterium]